MSFQSPLEPGFRSVPVTPTESTASLRLCVVVRESADPASGHFVLLQQTQDARVLLGTLTDSTGKVHEWLELWYQSVDDDEVNAVRDRHWTELQASLANSDAESHVNLEGKPSEPVFIDPKTWQCRTPATETGPIVLCTDDQALTAAGLPAYSGSSARFGSAPGTSKYYALNQAAAAYPNIEQLPGSDAASIPLNPEACGLAVRRFAPMAIDDFADVLGGKPWGGLLNSRKVFRLQGIYKDFADEAAIRTKGRHFLGTSRDIAGRVVETLYLKMTLLRQCMRRVADESRRTSLPLLNIDASSFGVGLGIPDSELPYCWSARVSLSRPGEAAIINAPGSRTKYFTSRGPASVSIFRPEELGLSRSGRGKVRLRRTFAPAEGGIVAEGTLVIPDRMPVGMNELIRITLPLQGSKSFTLIGTVDPSMALAPGETGFRTIPMDLNDELQKVLRSYEGTPFGQIPYEVIPPLSSPCDLYSLGVLGLRILLAGGDVSLPTALDAMLSLGRALSDASDEVPLAKTVAEQLKSDPRWVASLGPQYLIKDAPSDVVPTEVWSRVLALLVRFFPGLGPFSFCADLAAAPTEAPHAIYSEPLSQLDILNLRLRSLCFSSWRENSEVAALLGSYLE